MVPAESLAALDLLRALESAVAQAIRAAAHERDWPSGAMVLQHDDPSTDVFFVLRGGVRVTVLVSGGREIIFSDHGPGEQFGELAAIDQAPRSASVSTLFATRLLILPGAEFRAALAASPVMSGRLIRQMAGRVRGLSSRLVEIALERMGLLRQEPRGIILRRPVQLADLDAEASPARDGPYSASGSG